MSNDSRLSGDEFGDLTLEQLNSLTLAAFRGAPDVDSSSAAKEFNYSEERQRAKIQKLQNDNEMRKLFFAWASKLTAAIVVINSLLFAAYMGVHMWGQHPVPESVMIAWLTSTILEVLGIIAIIARYLYAGKSKATRFRTTDNSSVHESKDSL